MLYREGNGVKAVMVMAAGNESRARGAFTEGFGVVIVLKASANCQTNACRR